MLEAVLEGFGPIGAVAAAGLAVALLVRGRIRWGWFAAALATSTLAARHQRVWPAKKLQPELAL